MLQAKKKNNKLIYKKIFETRKKINELLNSIEFEKISVAELEKIFIKLSKVDKNELIPILLKRLNSSDPDTVMVSVEALKFLGDYSVIDHIISLIFNRKISDFKRGLFLNLLNNLGIDTIDMYSIIPFNDLKKTFKYAYNTLLEYLKHDSITYTIELVKIIKNLPPKIRNDYISVLVRDGDKVFLNLLKVLINVNDLQLVKISLKEITKIKCSESANILNEFIKTQSDKELIKLAERSLRKLSFQGIFPDEKIVNKTMYSHFKTIVSSIDYEGNNIVWITYKYKENTYKSKEDLKYIFLMINDLYGIIDCSGGTIEINELSSIYRKLKYRSILCLREVNYDYGIKLICNGLYNNNISKFKIPEYFYLLRDILLGKDEIIPICYKEPNFNIYYFRENFNDNVYVNINKLFKIPECKSWLEFSEEFYNLENIKKNINNFIRKIQLTTDFIINFKRKKQVEKNNINLLINLYYQLLNFKDY